MSIMRNMFTNAWLLGLFAIIGTGLVAYTFDTTQDRILANERAFLLKNLHSLVPPEMHDNDLFQDAIQVTDREMLGSKKPVTIYRARKNGHNVAAIINTLAPDGYNGNIELLVAVDFSGTIIGVRVNKHKETPGLGDAIETGKSNWILSFNGKSLDNVNVQGWHVKRDGGIFDQFTGATITPRAIVKAIHKTLQYYQQNRQIIFSKPSIRQIGQEKG